MSPDSFAAQPPDGPRRPFNLTRWFSLLSFVCISVASTFSSIVLSRFLASSLIERDARILAEVVQSIADIQDTDAYFLGHSTEVRESRIQEFFVHVGKLPDVLRTNIYARDQQVLWSSDPALIGKYLGPNEELSEALEGKVTVESGVVGRSGDPKPEHLMLGSADVRFVENYLPVRPSTGGSVIGVVEVYRVPTALFATINQGLRLIWAAALGGGLFLYLMLFWIVRRADRLIEEQSDRLLESEMLAMIGEMTAAITHGIRNPLASIRTSAELLQDDASTAAREAAGDITAEVDRLSEWVRQLLTYSTQEPARLEAVPLAPLLRSSVEGFEREMQRRGIFLDLAIAAALPAVRGERVRLSHALNSLLSNALEAMPGGGQLKVTAQVAAKGNNVHVTIRDSGVGIPRDQLPRVFAPFFTSKRKGLGLGLPLVNRIVTRFGGAVSIASEPGQWTEVQVELPIHST